MSKVQLRLEDRVAIVVLDDPAALNAIGPDMLDDLASAIDQAEAGARCMLLAASGRAFSAGGDLSALAASQRSGPIDAGALLESHVNPLLVRLAALSIPWISAVRGAAAGVGCSLALAADLVVASDNAYFLQAFSRVGLAPDGGSTWLLAKAAGRVRAMEMMLLGERIPAAQALDWGLVNRVVDDDALDATALALAQRLAAGPTRALALTRQLAWLAASASWPEALDAERAGQREAGNTQDVAEGVRAFLGKRPPQFVGE